MKHVVLLKSRARNQGGLEKYALRIASAFLEKGAKVQILTTGEIPAKTSLSYVPFKISRWPSFIRMELFDLAVRRWLKKNPADIVFGMDRNRFQTHFRAGNGVHAAYLKSRILTEGHLKHFVCHLNPMHRKILELEKAAFENPRLQKLFTNSHLVKQQVLEYYNIDPSKIEVIHNGVEWHEMESDFNNWEEKRSLCFETYHLNPKSFHFLFIGNGYLRKGLGALLEALSRMKNEDFHLSVIGKDNRWEAFQAKAAQLGLKEKVSFFGPKADTRLFYQMADVLAIPSFYDPFANVTIEALAMGLRVVSSKNNGGSEIITAENGIVIPDLLDIHSMATSLQESMQFSKTKQSALEIRSRIEKFDFSYQLRTLIDACG